MNFSLYAISAPLASAFYTAFIANTFDVYVIESHYVICGCIAGLFVFVQLYLAVAIHVLLSF